MSRLSDKSDRVLARLRKLCLSLPESSEVEAWGHPTFRAGKKIFASFGEHEDRANIGVKQTVPDQTILLQDDRIFKPPYVGQHGWIGIWVDQNVDWAMIEDLVLSSYRLVANKRMVAALDAAGG